MSNRYYEPGERRAKKVQDLFGAIATRYDLINDLQSGGMHRWWKRRMVRLSDLKPGDPALDICCGTGDIAFRLAKQGARVVGMDFSAPMLAVARDRTVNVPSQSGTLHRIRTPHFIRGDAQALPFSDASFQVVTVGYGLRNLADWSRGLEEMWRVLKPGGRLLVLDFGKPSQAFWRGIYFSYLRLVVPIFGRIFCGDAQAYSYILESLKTYPAQAGVARKLTELRAEDVRTLNLLGGAMSISVGRKAISSRPTT